MIKLVDLKQQYKINKKKINNSINEVLKKNNFIMGSEVQTLEKKLTKLTKSKYCVTVSSGTDALLIALMSININKGDEVIVPAFTYISPVEAIVRLGGKPVFVDVHKDSGNINTELIENKISKKTRAIIFVNLYGNMCNISHLKKIKQKNKKIVFIEDAAQSFGAKYKNYVSCNTLDISCTSFFPTKNLSCYGDGGAIFCNQKKYYIKFKMLREHGQMKKFHHDIIGIGGRLDTIQASILLSKLSTFKKEIAYRKKRYLFYTKLLSDYNLDNQKVKIFNFSKSGSPNYASFNIMVKPSIRKDLIKFLKKNQIDSTIYYPKTIPEQKPYKKFIGKNKVSNSYFISRRILSIPFSPYIKFREMNIIVKILSKFFFK